jgi:hypothetical protein
VAAYDNDESGSHMSLQLGFFSLYLHYKRVGVCYTNSTSPLGDQEWVNIVLDKAIVLSEGPDLVCLVHQLVLDGVAGEFRVGFHIHLLHDSRPVGAYRPATQCQYVGNLADRSSGRNQAHHLKLAV